MPTSRLRTLLLVTALCAGTWVASGAPSAAAPAGTNPTTAPTTAPAPTIPGTTSTTAPGSTAPVPDDPFEPGDAVDWVKDRIVLVIVVVGVLLLVGLWKFVSRGPSRKF